MKEPELLDDGFDDENANLLDAVEWWENKRLRYTMILFSVELLVMIVYWEGTLGFGIGYSIFLTLLYNIVANIFYTAGWAIEVWVLYYYKIKSFGDSVRLLLYLIGVVFSIYWTWAAYSTELIWY